MRWLRRVRVRAHCAHCVLFALEWNWRYRVGRGL